MKTQEELKQLAIDVKPQLLEIATKIVALIENDKFDAASEKAAKLLANISLIPIIDFILEKE